MRPIDVTRDEAVVWMLDVAQDMGPAVRFVAELLANKMRQSKPPPTVPEKEPTTL